MAEPTTTAAGTAAASAIGAVTLTALIQDNYVSFIIAGIAATLALFYLQDIGTMTRRAMLVSVITGALFGMFGALVAIWAIGVAVWHFYGITIDTSAVGGLRLALAFIIGFSSLWSIPYGIAVLNKKKESV